MSVSLISFESPQASVRAQHLSATGEESKAQLILQSESTALIGPLFFKSCWTECSREPEPHILEIAHQRARDLLPVKYHDMVINHLPKVVAFRIDDNESTVVIRLLMKRHGAIFAQLAIDDIKKRGRVRVITISRRLEIMEDLEPPDFWKCFWDTVRCKCVLRH